MSGLVLLNQLIEKLESSAFALVRRRTCLLTCSSGQTQCLGNHDVWWLGIRQNKQTSLWSQSPGCSASNILKPLAGAGADRKIDIVTSTLDHLGHDAMSQDRRVGQNLWPLGGEADCKVLLWHSFTRGESLFSRSMKDQTSERSLRGGQEVRWRKRGHGPSKPTPVPRPRGSLSLKTKPAPPHLILGESSRSAQTGLSQEMWTVMEKLKASVKEMSHRCTIRNCKRSLEKVRRSYSSLHLEWGGSFKKQTVPGWKTRHRPTSESQLADCVCVSVCVRVRAPVVTLGGLRSCRAGVVPAETALWCSVTSLMMYVKAHQYLDASWGKLRFFHFLCTHLHIFSMCRQTY